MSVQRQFIPTMTFCGHYEIAWQHLTEISHWLVDTTAHSKTVKHERCVCICTRELEWVPTMDGRLCHCVSVNRSAWLKQCVKIKFDPKNITVLNYRPSVAWWRELLDSSQLCKWTICSVFKLNQHIYAMHNTNSCWHYSTQGVTLHM